MRQSAFPFDRDRLQNVFIDEEQWLEPAEQFTFTMHGHSTFGLFDNGEKFRCDGIIRRTTIGKKQFEMIKTDVNKAFGIVNFLIQPNNSADVSLAEIGEIRFGRV